MGAGFFRSVSNPGWLLVAGRLLVVAAGFSLAACGSSKSGKSDSPPPTADECVQMADRMFPEAEDAAKREEKLERCLPTSN